ncbi:hypothetical protein STAFG_6949 [Streptomyces afghaniensis 772]|uniref:Uncharacterized protein n=1 Tax=Streptomyces afghaniensis 772 TaxID=1283301 RepID=S4M9D0_9ACTN|nr:hypothetical protein STAFG_6949 [Streptomyces afghaniensis 772]
MARLPRTLGGGLCGHRNSLVCGPEAHRVDGANRGAQCREPSPYSPLGLGARRDLPHRDSTGRSRAKEILLS